MRFIQPTNHFRKIAFDFDDTLAEGTWPSLHIGEPIPAGVQALLYYHHELKYECFIFTSRPASHIPAIRRWLEEHGLSQAIYDIKSDKPHYDLFIDDRAVKFPDGLLISEPGERRFWGRPHDDCTITDLHSHPPFDESISRRRKGCPPECEDCDRAYGLEP